MSEEKKYVEAEQNIIMLIPQNTTTLSVTATVMNPDGETFKCVANYGPSDIFDMRKAFLDNLYDDDYDAVYTLTDKGREYLNQLEKERENGIY